MTLSSWYLGVGKFRKNLAALCVSKPKCDVLRILSPFLIVINQWPPNPHYLNISRYTYTYTAHYVTYYVHNRLINEFDSCLGLH